MLIENCSPILHLMLMYWYAYALKKIDHLIILGNNYSCGCIFLVSLYYLRKWCRGRGGAYLTLWPRGRALIWGRVLITAWVHIWGNTLAYHCYRIKPILFCANTILFTEKGPWHFSNISTSRCRTYLNVEVIYRQCVYKLK